MSSNKNDKPEKIDLTITAVDKRIEQLTEMLKTAEDNYLVAYPERTFESMRIMARINSKSQNQIRDGHLLKAGSTAVWRYASLFQESGIISNLDEIQEVIAKLDFPPLQNLELDVQGKHEMKSKIIIGVDPVKYEDFTNSSKKILKTLNSMKPPKRKSKLRAVVNFFKALGAVARAMLDAFKSIMKDQ